jgi:hypothetical protein
METNKLTHRIPNGSPVTTDANLYLLRGGHKLRAAHGWAKYFVGCYRVGQNGKPFNHSLVYVSRADYDAATAALVALSGFHR